MYSHVLLLVKIFLEEIIFSDKPKSLNKQAVHLHVILQAAVP